MIKWYLTRLILDAIYLLFIFTFNKIAWNIFWALQIFNKMKDALRPDDERLLNLIRNSFLIPPSTEDYNFRNNLLEIDERNAEYPTWDLIDSILEAFYPDIEKTRFYVEAGALDGEYLTNTLHLEMEKGWSGLLVEPDADNFKLLKRANRKAWLTESCFSVHKYPETVVLKKLREVDEQPDWLMRATSVILKVQIRRVHV